MNDRLLRMTFVGLGAMGLVAHAWAQSHRLGWRADFGLSPDCFDTTNDVAVDKEGNLIIAGSARIKSGTSANDFATIRKMSPLGEVLWEKRFLADAKNNRPATGLKVAVDATGDVYVASSSPVDTTVPQAVLARFSGATGDLLWTKVVRTGNDAFTINALGIDPAGNIVFAGGFGTNSRVEFAVVKFTPAGDQVWLKRWKPAGSQDTAAFTLAFTKSSEVVVGGYTTTQTAAQDSAVIKLSATGDKVWETIFPGSPTLGRDRVRAVTVDAGGDVYATGDEYIESSSNTLFARRMSGSTGAVVWHSRLMVPRNNSSSGIGIAVEAGGDVTVGGEAYLTTADGPDLLVIRFSAQGAEKWRQPVNSAGNNTDTATGFAVDQLGNAYISGTATPTSGADRFSRYVVARVTGAGKLDWTYHDATGFGAKTMDALSAMVMDRRTGHVSLVGTPSSNPESDARFLAVFQAPVAVADSQSVEMDKTLTVNAPGVLANDHFHVYTKLSVLEPPKIGTLALEEDGSFKYTPPAGFVGEVTFKYRLTREGLTPGDASVRIDVRKPPKPASD